MKVIEKLRSLAEAFDPSQFKIDRLNVGKLIDEHDETVALLREAKNTMAALQRDNQNYRDRIAGFDMAMAGADSEISKYREIRDIVIAENEMLAAQLTLMAADNRRAEPKNKGVEKMIDDFFDDHRIGHKGIFYFHPVAILLLIEKVKRAFGDEGAS